SAQFFGTTFEKRAFFQECTFPNGCRFNGTRFNDQAFFWRTTFGSKTDDPYAFKEPTFNNCTFEKDAIFDRAEFDNAIFWNTRFKGLTSFEGALFSTRASFQRCSFLGKTIFAPGREENAPPAFDNVP